MPGWEKRPGVGAHSKDWPHIRLLILHRDGHTCTWVTNGVRCPATATTVDRIIPLMDGGTEDENNLRSLCPPHHQAKSSAEGGRAARRTSKYRGKRPPEPHPGIKREGRT